MGLFGKSKTEKFQDKFVETWKLVENFSYLSGVAQENAIRQLDKTHNELKAIGKTFPDLFNVHFKMRIQIGELLGEEVSVGFAYAIIQSAFMKIFRGNRQLSAIEQDLIVSEAHFICSSYEGQERVKYLINS